MKPQKLDRAADPVPEYEEASALQLRDDLPGEEELLQLAGPAQVV